MDNESLMNIVERIERFNDQIADANSAKKDIMAEAKSLGFIPKAVSWVVRQRKKDRDQRAEEKDLFETYEKAVGLE